MGIERYFAILRDWLILTAMTRPSSSALAALGITLVLFLLSCSGISPDLRAGRLGAEQEGRATYYSMRLAGRKTANGERYNPSALTAAHPVLPFGKYVRVTRLDSRHQSVVVRINDRCSGKKKIIDLSAAAARQLDMIRAGIVPVHIRVVEQE